MLLRAKSARRLAARALPGIRAIGELDVAAGDDLDEYNRASPQMIELVAALATKLGPPHGIVGIHEHTTLPAARLRERFGVPGTSVRTATLCRDKVVMKQAVAGAGIVTPRFWPVDAGTTAKDLADALGPLPGRKVLKPRSQAASLGVRIFADTTELLDEVRRNGCPDDHEVEEFVDGTVCHLDGVVRDGEIIFLCGSSYVTSCFDFRFNTTPLASVTIDDPATLDAALHFAADVLDAVGLTSSVFHLEAFLLPDGSFVFLEIANRFGGAGIQDHIQLAYGVDLAREAVLACLGDPSEVTAGPVTMLERMPGRASGWLYTPFEQTDRGIVVRVSGVDDLPRSVAAARYPQSGDVVGADPGVWEASGRFVLVGSSAAGLEDDIATITGRYRVHVLPEGGSTS
ncbi:ATP-grasp domain-containing protein [Rathayibacter tritici]|uniref:ATP-grasp domain-containing protein n=1 Tax=Rathayibacter tritici TaxID=33888 RepID=UPI0011AFFF0D|nr:hypothetical protein [Rathayibacter tritici]